MAYSAGLLLDQERYYGVDGGEPPALPFLCVRLEWPLALGFRAAYPFTSAELARGVHAVQDTVFHRPFRIGERVQARGQIVQARQTRAGALMVIRYQSRAVDTGDVIATTWSTSIFRGLDLPTEPFSLVEPPAAIAPDLAGTQRQLDWPVPIHLTHAYSECAAIWNPIHTEEPVARAAGLPRIIVHGTILWAIAGLALAELSLGGDVDRIARLTGRFVAPVIPGGVVTVITQGDDKAIGWRLLDAASGRVCVDGQAEIR